MRVEQPKPFRDFISIHDKAELYEKAPSIVSLLIKLADPELNDDDFEVLINEHNASAQQPTEQVAWYAFDIKQGRALEVGIDKTDDSKIVLGAWKPKL